MLTMLRSVAQDERFLALRGRLRSVGHLLTGNFAEALIGLMVIAVAARALGPKDYGILVLAFSFVWAIERLVSFQAWQPLVRYGAALTGEEQRDDLRSLLKFGLGLDLLGAFGGWMIGVTIALAGGFFFGWSEETRRVMLLTCSILPFRLMGMPTAALRIFGAYKSIAWVSTVGTGLRLAGSLLAWALGGDIFDFTLAWVVGQIAAGILFLWYSFRVLRRHGVTRVLSAPTYAISERFDGIWRFALSANLSLTLRSSANQLDILLVGAIAGPASAGLYHIAKRAGKVAEQVGIQAQAVLYPDLSRHWSRREYPEVRAAVMQMELLLFGLGLLGTLAVLLVGEPLIRLAIGDRFAGAWNLMLVQMIAVTLMMAGTGARSALLAMGEDRLVLKATIIGTVIFHVTALILVPEMGPMGANIAHVLLGLVCGSLMIIGFRRKIMSFDR